MKGGKGLKCLQINHLLSVLIITPNVFSSLRNVMIVVKQEIWFNFSKIYSIFCCIYFIIYHYLMARLIYLDLPNHNLLLCFFVTSIVEMSTNVTCKRETKFVKILQKGIKRFEKLNSETPKSSKVFKSLI